MSRFLQKIFLSRLFEIDRSGTKNGATSLLATLENKSNELLESNPFSKANYEAFYRFKPVMLLNLLLFALVFFKPVDTQAQFVINNQGCVIGDFGINSNLYANESLTSAPFGPVDWFKKSTGRNVIIQDPATVAALQGRLQNEDDPVFEIRMNGGLGSYADYVDANNYKVLIDAIWARDYNSFSDFGLDLSGFNQSAKNGQNPSIDWLQQSRNIGGKNDVIDVAGHMFRTVTPTSDDLWFMGLINIAEPNGDSYMDFEFFVDDVKVTNGAFTTTGADAGHTAFQFNADGSIKRVGDMIYNMGLVNGGSQADVEIRIWVSKADYDAFFASPPANLPFNFGAEFDGDGNGATFGYASVVPKNQGSDVCGYVNLDGEFPEAAPWGTKNGNSNTYATSYQPFAVAELGINLTAFGLDNKLSSGDDNDPCFFPWITYMVKTRTSNSFTASLSDMAGPFTWGQSGVSIVEQNDAPSISCETPTTTLTATPFRDDATYTWSTTDGSIVDGTDINGTITKTGGSIEVDAAGNYTVTMTLPNGCEYTGGPIAVIYDNTVSCNPSWKLTKTATEQSFDAVGDVINYTIELENDGDVAISTVTVEDPKATSGPTYVSGDTGDDDILSTGEKWIYSATYTVTQADVDAGSFENTATASGTIPNGTIPDAEGTETVNATQTPSWTLTKSTTDTYSAAGDELTYTIEVENTGNVSISSVVVEDDKASTGPTYVSGDSNEDDILGVGETWVYTATSVVAQSDVDAGSFENTATATGTPAGGALEPAEGSETVNATQTPSWTLTKSSTDTYDAAGDVLNYTIEVENTGNVTISNVSVTDPKASSGPTYASGDANSNNKLDVGEIWTYTASATVTQADVDAGSFTNEATATGTPAGGSLNPAKGSKTIDAIQEPSLTLVKTGVFNDENENGRADAGETISYTFLVTNTGNVSLTNVTVSDPMVTVMGGPISLAVGEASGNTFTATYTIDQDDINAGEVVNTASAESDQTDPVESEETTNLPQEPFLEFSKSTETSVYSTLGEVIRYRLTLVNSGNLPIEDVEVTDPLATTGPDYLGGDSNSNGILEIGEEWIYVATVTITQRHLDDGSFTNIAKATGKSVDGRNLEITDQQKITAVQNPSWTLTKSSSDTYDAAGDELNYTIAVKNTGNVTISNVVVTDPKASSGPTYASGDTNSNNKLEVGETWIYTAKATVTQADVDAGSFTNEATASGTPAGGTLNPAKGSKTVNAIQNPSWTLTKSSSDTYDAAGDELNYTIAVKNTGNVTISNVAVTDPKASSGPTYVSGDTNSNNKLDVGETWTYTAKATVTQADVDAGSFTNEATATGTPAGGTLNPAKGSKTVEAIQSPSWTISKTAAEKSYEEVGEVLNYTIVVVNTGNITISNVSVSDPKATSGPTYASGDTNTNNKLDVGETWTYTATYSVKAADIEAGSFTNEATVTGTPAGGNLEPAKGSHLVVALVARPNVESTPFNTSVSGDASKNDTYPAGSTFTKTSEAKNGTVVFNADGTYTYKPNDGFTGVDSFTYKVCLPSPNGTVCEETTVTIVVGPNAVDDKFVSLQNRDVKASVVGNDTYPAGSIFSNTSSPSNGTLTFNPDGTFTYVPDANFTGKDTFTYKVCFTEGDVTLCEDATVVLEILPFKSEPDVNATFVNVPVNGNVATNDKVTAGTTYGDPGAAKEKPQGSNPQLKINSDGSFSFVTDVPGIYVYMVPVCPPVEGEECALEPLTITVLDINVEVNAPIAHTDIAETRKGKPVTLQTLSNDRPGGKSVTLNPASVKIMTQPKNGTVSVNPQTGDITYTPNAGFVGVDTYTYQVCDTSNPAKCVIADQKVTVLGENAPNSTLASDDFAVTSNKLPVSGNVLKNDTDSEGNIQKVTPQKVSLPQGEFEIKENGEYTFVPKPGFIGPVEIVYQVCDNGTPGACAKATIYFLIVRNSIEAINDNFQSKPINGLKGGVAGNVLTNDLLNERPVKADEVVISILSDGGLKGVTIDALGNLNVPKGTPVGTYIVHYSICEVVDPTNCSDAIAVVEVFHGVDLAINKRAEETDLWEGDEFAYILTVGNVGDTDASEVVVIDNLPAGLEYKSAQLVGTTGLTLTTVVEGQKVTMKLPTLKAGQVVEIKLSVKARPLSAPVTETILNTASVASKETELKPADNTSSTAVRIQPFFIPNVITPNGDGKNDEFVIKGLGKFRSNEIVIFNRYGDHVFQKKGYQNDWAGEGLVSGTYFYILSVVDINGNPTEFKGWIQLIRE